MTDKSLSVDILSRVKASVPGIYIQAHEEQRVISELFNVCDNIKYGLYVWSCPRGLQALAERYLDADNKPGLKKPDKGGEFKADTGQPLEILEKLLTDAKLVPKSSIVVLRLFHHFLDDPAVQTYILDILNKFKNNDQCLVITTPVLKLPTELEKHFSVVTCELPTKELLLTCLEGILEVNESVAKGLTKENREKIAEAALGMTLIEAGNAFCLALVKAKGDELATVIAEEKAQFIKKQGILEIIEWNKEGVSQIGGLANFKTWLSKRKNVFSQKAREFGLPSPKGILLVGPSGSGKTLACKAIAAELGLPLLKFDLGKAFGSLVGQSESNMRSALATAEAMAPVVMLLDECEKALTGGGGGELDGGTSQRVIGTMLQWMSENKSQVFIVATANNVHGLPPELLRKGRFDEIFSVMLPNASERKDIIELHLTKRNRKKLIGASPKIDLAYFSALTEGFSGAEIEMAIVEALHTAFDEDRELKAKDLEDVIKETKPLSVSMKDKMDATISWCKANTRSANGIDENEVKVEAKTSNEAEGKPTALSLASAIAGSSRKIKAN